MTSRFGVLVSAAMREPDTSRALAWMTRFARALGLAAGTFFTLAAGWGLFGVIGGGHYGVPASCSIAAENMLHWKILAPAIDYAQTKPLPEHYYCHHPFMTFWEALPGVLVGHHDWGVLLPGVVLSALTIVLVYQTAKTAWGALGAAAATCGYAVLPMTLSFSNFNSLEVSVCFGWALFFWGHARALATSKKRYVVASVVGAVWAVNADWIGFVGVALVLVYALARMFLPTRFFGHVKPLLYARWWILTTCVICASFFAYFILFVKWNTLSDLLGSMNMRSSGSGTPLQVTLAARKYRIESCFPPPVILLGKIAAPIALLRVVVRRRDEEFFSVVLLVSATAQYLGFKQAADIHIFWPYHFGLYFAFAFAQLVMTLRWVAEKIFALLRRRWAKTAAFGVGLGFVTLFTIALLPDGLRGLYTGRATWGRFNQETLRWDTNLHRVAKLLVRRVAPGDGVAINSNLDWNWAIEWALDGVHATITGLPKRGSVDAVNAFYVARASRLSGGELVQLANDWHLEIYGDIVVADLRRAPGPLTAFTYQEHEPNPIEWYFLGGGEPAVSLAYDPFATWEWRTHLGQPADVPTVAPVTPNELRIAYNIAVEAKDAPRVSELRAKIDALIAPDVTARFTQGVTLIGERHINGVMPREEVWFHADGPTQGEAEITVAARMIAPDPWSFIHPDTLVRPLTQPMPMPTHLWRPGYLYTEQLILYPRIGTETFAIGWAPRDGGPAPVRSDGPPVFDLVTVR
jgi:Dolichyl-phosphate-mannose-protein mannosyltransferase